MPNMAARVFQMNAHFDSCESFCQCTSLAYVAIFWLVSIVLQYFPHCSIENNQENLTYRGETRLPDSLSVINVLPLQMGSGKRKVEQPDSFPVC